MSVMPVPASHCKEGELPKRCTTTIRRAVRSGNDLIKRMASNQQWPRPTCNTQMMMANELWVLMTNDFLIGLTTLKRANPIGPLSVNFLKISLI